MKIDITNATVYCVYDIKQYTCVYTQLNDLIHIVLYSNIWVRYYKLNTTKRKDGKHYVLYRTYKMEIK